MLFLHETHQVVGARQDEFEAAYREGWMPTLADGDEARLLWYTNHAPTGPGRPTTWSPSPASPTARPGKGSRAGLEAETCAHGCANWTTFATK